MPEINWVKVRGTAHSVGKLGDYEVRKWAATKTDPAFAVVTVPSARDPEKTYDVVLTAEGSDCTCPSSNWRPWAKCKHRLTIEGLLQSVKDGNGS